MSWLFEKLCRFVLSARLLIGILIYRIRGKR